MRARRTPFMLAALLVVSTGLSASAAQTTLRFTHPDPSQVEGFTIHLGYAHEQYRPELTQTFAGLTADSNGIYEVTIDIEPDRQIFVAVRAYSDTETSAYSNERTRFHATPLGLPGRPRLVN